MNAEHVTLDACREDLARRSRDHGATSALSHAAEWHQAAQLVLDELIESGCEFTSEDVRLITGPALSNGGFGALFLRAAKAGRIRCVGYERSRRPARHSGMVRTWIRTDPP